MVDLGLPRCLLTGAPADLGGGGAREGAAAAGMEPAGAAACDGGGGGGTAAMGLAAQIGPFGLFLFLFFYFIFNRGGQQNRLG